MDKLEKVLADIEKRFGKGAIFKLGENPDLDIEWVSTGSIGLDIAIGGGIPKGRIIEIYGPESSGKTTVCQHIIAESQKNGGVCAFIDMEHALDPIYAKQCGVDIDNLFVSQPDTGEQALDITEALIRSGTMDIIVVDSVAALVPRAEIEGEMGQSHMGLQARLMSQACRKLSPIIKTNNSTLIFTNQLRHKIGVMFGCFQYNTRVLLADGTVEKIGKIVNQKMNIEVLSYNNQTRQLEPRRVVDWYENGTAEHFLQFKVVKPYENGRSSFATTKNHLIKTPNGYKQAGELEVGDLVMSIIPSLKPTTKLLNFLVGSLLGDGSLRLSRNKYTAQLRIGHGKNQTEYCRWKQTLLSSIANSGYKNNIGGWSFGTSFNYLFRVFYDDFYQNNHKQFSRNLINHFGEIALAIWFMDDGTSNFNKRYRSSIACKTLEQKESRELLQILLKEKWDINTRWYSHSHSIVFPNKKEVIKLNKVIAQYVHPSMDYKLLPEYRKRFIPFNLDMVEIKHTIPTPITKIYTKPITKSMKKFDLKIEGNHNYIVDGVIVHNSPEVTSGGNALKFYASVRLDTRRIQTEKDKGEAVSNKTRVKVKKNKVAPPFKECEFSIIYGEGIDKLGEIRDFGVSLDLIKKAGAYYSVTDISTGEIIKSQGKLNFRNELSNYPELVEYLENEIKTHYLTD